MKPHSGYLVQRKGNWVFVSDRTGKARPATPVELYLWERVVETQELNVTLLNQIPSTKVGERTDVGL